MTITYEVGSGLYVNTTNRCSNACEFCVRSTVESYYGDLWLRREPTVDEICESIFARDLTKYIELVFCGYGEPTERIDDILEVARRVKERSDLPIRINTNGQGSMIAGYDITPKMAGLIDVLSISLNTADAASYQKICHSRFGEAAYQGLLDFAKVATRYVPKVVLSVVDTTIPPEEIERCREIAAECGVSLRVREFISNEDE
ncbi:MAG: radical SAM protein [Clostridia bacterium]|nr:radical SAM protein [Clostridia bacterium]